MEIDVKKIIIAVIIALIVIGGIVFAVIVLGGGNKDYILEEIKEEDYKYFAVYTKER